MTQKNSYRTSNSDDNFNLDDYIREKSDSEGQSDHFESENNEGKSSWFRNTVLLLSFGVVTLLYFNNWNPLQVYGNIFGIEKYQAGYVAPAPEPPEPLVIKVNPGNGAQVVNLSELEKLAELKSLEGLRALQELEALSELAELERLGELEELENSLAELESTEEMNKLREFALKTAMEALEGIGNSPEFGEAIGEASQIGIQEALRELEKLRELEISEAGELAEQARNVNSSFVEYSSELTNAGLDDKFNNSTLQKFYEANVPASFLKQLDQLGVLEKMDADNIIKAYQEKGN